MRHFHYDILSELNFKTSRSGGKGGQHVNKTESKVEVSFDLVNSGIISDTDKEILLAKLENKLHNGVLSIVAQDDRSQKRNKEIAIQKLFELLDKALTPVKKRKKTKASKAVKEKRKKDKKRKSETKELRKKIW